MSSRAASSLAWPALLAAAGALSEALGDSELLGEDPVHSYWARFTGWLRSQKIEVSELGIAAKAHNSSNKSFNAEAGVGIKLNLKTDPEFRKRVRERMKLHVGAFREEVHDFAQDCLKRLRAQKSTTSTSSVIGK